MKQREENSFVNEYRTGGADFPGCNHLYIVGITVLAVLLIVLLVAASWILRAELLSSQHTVGTLSLSPEHIKPESTPYMEGDVVVCEDLGFHCQAISEFCERIYALPSGVYVVSVQSHTPAEQLGVLPGDVLVGVNGQSLRAPETLDEFLRTCPKNGRLALEFRRKEKTYTVYFTPGE